MLDEESTLSIGDTVVTGKSAWVELRLCDGSAIKVGEKTKFKFEDSAKESDSFTGWAFSLLKGSLLAAIQGEEKSDKVKLRVRTPTASIGVRGTEFMVESDDAEGTSLHTLEGEVLMGTPEDYEQLRELKGPALAEKFEAVPKERMSRIARGEMRPVKAMAFRVAELRQKRVNFFERKLAVLNRPEAMKRMAVARQKFTERRMNANAQNKRKDADGFAGAKPAGATRPGALEKKEERKERREEKKEERKEQRQEKREGSGKAVNFTDRFEKMQEKRSGGSAPSQVAPSQPGQGGDFRKKGAGDSMGSQPLRKGPGAGSPGRGGGGNRRKGN